MNHADIYQSASLLKAQVRPAEQQVSVHGGQSRRAWSCTFQRCIRPLQPWSVTKLQGWAHDHSRRTRDAEHKSKHTLADERPSNPHSKQPCRAAHEMLPDRLRDLPHGEVCCRAAHPHHVWSTQNVIDLSPHHLPSSMLRKQPAVAIEMHPDD